VSGKKSGRRGRRPELVNRGESLVAAIELERVDAGAPVEAARVLDVFLGEPERAVVGWIDLHRAIVSPAV